MCYPKRELFKLLLFSFGIIHTIFNRETSASHLKNISCKQSVMLGWIPCWRYYNNGLQVILLQKHKYFGPRSLFHSSVMLWLMYIACAFLNTYCVCKIQNLQKRILKNAFLTATHPYNACNQLGVKLFFPKSCMNIHYSVPTANSKECWNNYVYVGKHSKSIKFDSQNIIFVFL